MKRASLARLAALGSSIVLVAVYVSCRATNREPEAPAAAPDQDVVLPGSKSAEIFPTPRREPTVMSGSKSAPILRPEAARPAPQQQAPRPDR